MEMELERKGIPCLRQRVRQVQNQEQTLEVKLPEGYPDIAGILCAWGQCLLRSKEWRQDSIGVSGGVMAWVLYRPADGSDPRWVEAWLPAQLKWELPESVREGTVRASWCLKGVDARMLSARKILVRAAVSVLAEALEPSGAELSVPGDVPEDVQLLRRTYPAMVPCEAGEKTFLMDEEFPLPEEEGSELIACMGKPVLTEQKVMGNRGIFRGALQLHLVLRDGNGQVRSLDLQPEFSQFADLDREYEGETSLSAMMAVSSLEPELQEGRLRLKCGVVAQYTLCQRMLLEVVEDAYSPLRSVEPSRELLELPMLLDSREQLLQGETHLTAEPARVADVSVWTEQPQVRRAGALSELEVPGAVQMLYYDDKGELQSATGRFRGLWECPVGADAVVYADVLPAPEPQLVYGEGETDVLLPIPMEVTTWNTKGVPAVTALNMGEPMDADPERPSLILCRRGQKSLWELAKTTGSTVEKICRANGLTEEPLDDRLLLIPVL